MTKEKILIATLELASEKGLGNVSLSMIADRVNIRKASLFSHYKSKDEIIENMYSYFREEAKKKDSNPQIDLTALFNNRSLEEILNIVVASYDKMNDDPHLLMFYRVIMSERVFNPVAAKMMVNETDKMNRLTYNLFTALVAENKANIPNIEATSIMFSNAIHSLLDFRRDCQAVGSDLADGKVEEFIKEFSRIYGR